MMILLNTPQGQMSVQDRLEVEATEHKEEEE